MRNLLLTLPLLLLAVFPAQAEPQHAIALHGDVKYPVTFTHFDYVNPDAPKGGTLRLPSIGTFDSLNPFIVKGVPADGIGSLTIATLMEQAYDEPFSMYGLIAESVDLADDRASVSFTLRPQAKWDDGSPITADDVVWTFETLMKDGSPFYKAYYGDVKEVKADTPVRVTFIFKNGDNRELPLILAQMPVLPKAYWTAEGRKFGETTLTPMPGSGPYEIGAIAPGRSIEYIRKKDWWGNNLPVTRGRYNFDRITYSYYRDVNVALEAFFAGEYDLQQESVAKLWATAYDAPPVKDGRIVKEEIANTRPAGMQGFLYNLRRPVFQDREVRKALAYAFDFEWSNKQFAFGTYTRTRSYFENSDLAAKGLPQGKELEILEKYRGKIPDDVFTAEYAPPTTDGSGNARANLKKAADILDAAGYKLGADGVRVHEKTGTRLEFQIVDSNPAFERWTLPFVQNLKRIGVAATFRVVDDAQFQTRMQTFDFDMTTGVIPQSDSPGNEQRDFWSSSKADVPGGRNYLGVKDPVVDELVEGMIASQSREGLVTHAHALDRVLQWNYNVIPHWYYGAWRLAWWKKLQHPERLSGMTPGVADTWWIEEVKKQ
jgi:microcin C transport system substrate-binding protein